MTEPLPDTVTLALVQTKNGMKACEIIAMLAVCSVVARRGEMVYRLGGNNDEEVAVAVDFPSEIIGDLCHGLNEGLRDRRYLMPLEMAQDRIEENPKKLKLLHEQYTVKVFEPHPRTVRAARFAFDRSA